MLLEEIIQFWEQNKIKTNKIILFQRDKSGHCIHMTRTEYCGKISKQRIKINLENKKNS